MLCPLMETENAPLCLGGMRIFLLWILCLSLTPYLPYNRELSSVSNVTLLFIIPIIRDPVLSLEVYTQYDICHQ